MTEQDLEKLKYPIGKFNKPTEITDEFVMQSIKEIETLPERLKAEVAHLSNEQLDTPYRPNGWTVRQVVHHCADSHMNAFIRLKLALTEDHPTIKAYSEAKWAELPDAKLPVAISLELLQNLHTRWVNILRSLNKEQLQRTFYHPQYNKEYILNENIGMYAWHGNHHLAHITTLKKNMNWK